jgi:hypothetical protein
MSLLQNYLGLEPAYKDSYDPPLLGMMQYHCIEIGHLNGPHLQSGHHKAASGRRGGVQRAVA